MYKGFGRQISINESINNIILNKVKVETGSDCYKGFKQLFCKSWYVGIFENIIGLLIAFYDKLRLYFE